MSPEYPTEKPKTSDTPMRILIADDDAVIRTLIQRVLQKEGYPMLIAKDGTEAWRIYQEERPELVITDWEMPGLNGIELCKKIRKANEESPLQPFILMLTSRNTKKDLAKGFFEALANEFIAKPFNKIELLARFRAGAKSMALQIELEKQRKINETLAMTDSLTGLVNRRALMQTLRVDEDRSRRSRQPLGVVMTDVDKFKTINDEFGHNTGDQVLKVVSDCLRACIRSGDHVGRWGGEEFLLVLPNTDIIQAAEIAERCRALLAQQEIRAEDGRLLKISSSFGVASADGVDRPDVMELVNEADKALYWAKEAGRNRVKIYVASADPERKPSAS